MSFYSRFPWYNGPTFRRFTRPWFREQYRLIRCWMDWSFKGMCDRETWGLDTSTIRYLIPRLERMKEVQNGFPGSLEGMDEWNSIIDKILDAFKLYNEDTFVLYSIHESADEHARAKEGFRLFRRWWRDLWW